MGSTPIDRFRNAEYGAGSGRLQGSTAPERRPRDARADRAVLAELILENAAPSRSIEIVTHQGWSSAGLRAIAQHSPQIRRTEEEAEL
jgi:hypothetical protein